MTDTMASNPSALRVLWRVILIMLTVVVHLFIIPPFATVMFAFASVTMIFDPLLIFFWGPLFVIPYLMGWMVLLWLW